MDILPGFKLCRKGLHQYPAGKKRCPKCRQFLNEKWNKANKEKRRKHQEKYRNTHPDRIKKSQEKYKETNSLGFQKARKKWEGKNKDKLRESKRKWRLLNKGRVNSWCAKRRAFKKQAIPPWANKKSIEQVYKKAAELTKKTGIKHEVDHIYPLQSKYMCGLHVETNLQILTREQNRAKSNRIWPGQFDCQKD
jgi:hypothetical protein